MLQTLVLPMLPVEKGLAGANAELPAATAQACLPYWLETAGWLAALLSDAAAAAMGRLPATPRPETPYSKMHASVGGWALAVEACSVKCSMQGLWAQCLAWT